MYTNSYWMPASSKSTLCTPDSRGTGRNLRRTARLDDLKHESRGGILMDETNIDINTSEPQVVEWCGHRVDYCMFNLTATVRDGFQALQTSRMHKYGQRCHRGATYFPRPGKQKSAQKIGLGWQYQLLDFKNTVVIWSHQNRHAPT